MAMPRVNFLGGPQFYNLQCAAATLREAFGAESYLVGSALERRDFRDVDVRCILEDDDFDILCPASQQQNPNAWDGLWCLLNAALSEWLAARTGLPIDFQIQRRSQAEAQEKGPRYVLGFARDSGDSGLR
jgi:hypothetical protein